MDQQYPDAIANRANSNMLEKQSWWLRVYARLNPGVSVARAQTEADGILQQILKEIESESNGRPWTQSDRSRSFDRRIALQSGGEGYSSLAFEFAKPLYILMTIVGLVLLIACANVANLLLARAATRQKEIAVRLSLGASRFRLIRQLLTESVLLSLLGGILGLIFSRLFASLLAAYISPEPDSLVLDLNPDARILTFTVAISLITGILFGLAPALRATGFDLVPALKETGNNFRMVGARITIDKVLVVVQVALSLFLLIGAGLFVRSLEKLKSVDIGFDPENVLVFTLDMKPAYKPDQRANLKRQLLAKLETLPGTRSASVAGYTQLSGYSSGTAVSVPGYTPSADDNMVCHVLDVGPRYFETMGIPILMGRDFNQNDNVNTASSEPNQTGQSGATLPPTPTIINQTMAEFFWKGENPIGRQFKSGNLTLEVIGVAKDAKYEDLREKIDRAFFRPYFIKGHSGSTFIVRTFGDPTAAVTSVQKEVKELDKDALVLDVRTMQGVVDTSLVQERFIAELAGFFSLFALLLACLGLYGIMSYGVVRRTREMGIRMALGAPSSSVIWMVMRQSLLLVLIGVAIAIPAAAAASHSVSSYLFGLSADDPTTIAMATIVLIAVAGLAGFLPARRASRIDPMEALRYE